MSGNRTIPPRPSAVAGFDGYVHPGSGGRLGRTAGAAAGSGRSTGNIGARARFLLRSLLPCHRSQKAFLLAFLLAWFLTHLSLLPFAGGNVMRGSYNPPTLPGTPPQTRGASWGKPQTPLHNGPAGISETQRWAYTTVGVKTPRTSSSGYGVIPKHANREKILKPNWFSWQD